MLLGCLHSLDHGEYFFQTLKPQTRDPNKSGLTHL